MGGRRGRLVQFHERIIAVELIDEAVDAGARQNKACKILEISVRTYQRWVKDGSVKADGRPESIHPKPAHAYSEEETKAILEVINSEEYSSSPPSQIVPKLADKGIYLCSEATMYRILHNAKQLKHRGRSKAPKRRIPETHIATGSNQVWCWDITWLPGPAKGIYHYLYLMLDIFSRKIVGWEIHEDQTAEKAGELLQKACRNEGVNKRDLLVLHSDNGSPMKGSSMLAMMDKLGVASSYSRPRVSNDNSFAESIFRTCKYRPDYPHKGFLDLTAAREWVHQFVTWYNEDHQHSGIKFVSPLARHEGKDIELLGKRTEVYLEAKNQNPRRWSGNVRNWDHINSVSLNPVSEKILSNLN